jgi:membrane associated rhomboid family serine protease
MKGSLGWRRAIHILRLVASFGLLGAILTGIVFGWVDHEINFRVIGALVGAAVGIVVMVITYRSGDSRRKHWPA